MAEDRRSTPRAEIQVNVTYHSTRRRRNDKTVVTRNLGGDGICFITNEVLDPESHLEMQLHLPKNPEPIACEAIVIWQKELEEPPKGYEGIAIETGVKFVHIDSDSKAKLIECVKQYGSPF